LVHDATAHRASVSWSSNAHSGTWQKTGFKTFDTDGAVSLLTRVNIGSSEDLSHSGGITNLNIS
jgi:hypothetical protein